MWQPSCQTTAPLTICSQSRQFGVQLLHCSYIALDLSFNRIFSESWEPILQVVGRLGARVDNLHLGGNYLPALIETDKLRKLQHSGCVSLALPITGSPVNEWQEKWNNIAVDFGTKAYDYNAPDYG